MPKRWELGVFLHNELLHHIESKNYFQSTYLWIFDNSNAHISAKPDTIWMDSDTEENVKNSTILPWSDPQAILHLQLEIGPYILFEARSVGRILVTVGESCSPFLHCWKRWWEWKGRDKISTIELNSNTANSTTAEPVNSTKLNTNKPTTKTNSEAKATVNKTATTVLSTDLAKLEAAELEGM